jgi:hypothetical protein
MNYVITASATGFSGYALVVDLWELPSKVDTSCLTAFGINIKACFIFSGSTGGLYEFEILAPSKSAFSKFAKVSKAVSLKADLDGAKISNSYNLPVDPENMKQALMLMPKAVKQELSTLLGSSHYKNIPKHFYLLGL